MSNPPGGPPPPYYGYGYPGQHPYPPPAHPPPHPPPGSYAYVPAPVVMPIYHPPPPENNPTYVTNYIYQQPPAPPTVAPVPPQPDVGQNPIDWVSVTSTTAYSYANRAVVAGKEGWDSSPLWVIRAHHGGELVPGKLAIKHKSAYIPHGGKEIPVHHFEVMLANPSSIRWLPSSNGQVPVGAIPGGNTHNGETLYIARVKHLKSITPGKVHPSHGCCYISFGGAEITYRSYEVLCKIVG